MYLKFDLISEDEDVLIQEIEKAAAKYFKDNAQIIEHVEEYDILPNKIHYSSDFIVITDVDAFKSKLYNMLTPFKKSPEIYSKVMNLLFDMQ